MQHNKLAEKLYVIAKFACTAVKRNKEFLL